jgi:hypothetical protein
MTNGERRIARVFELAFAPCYLPFLQVRVRAVSLKRAPTL